MAVSDFSAKEPALGYHYQILHGLYLLLKQGDNTSSLFTLESLDDITIDSIDTLSLYQTKLHINHSTTLSERSSDLWKTIRVWSEGILDGTLSTDTTFFHLVTTQNISNGTFLEKMKPGKKRDIKAIVKHMTQIASEVSNATNCPAYRAFNLLSDTQKEALIKNIYILDASLDTGETIKKLKEDLRLSAPPDKLEIFFDELIGWWFIQCIEILQNKSDSISYRQLHIKIQNIRDKYKLDNLPDDFPNSIEITDDELTHCQKDVFVKQLTLVGVGNEVKRIAISDYKRAYSQRSKWVREGLVIADELATYDSRIHEDWERAFAFLKDDTADSTEEEKITKGRTFYRSHCSKDSNIKFRESFQPAYLETGSIHMLSDLKRLGWHPDFEIKINEE